MILHQISPYIRVAMDNIVEGPWIIHDRVLFDYELLYIMEGKVICTIEDTIYKGERGDIFLFRPKQRHKIVKVEGSYTGKYLKPILERDKARSEDYFKRLKALEDAAV